MVDNNARAGNTGRVRKGETMKFRILFSLFVMFSFIVNAAPAATLPSAESGAAVQIYRYGGDSTAVWYDVSDGCTETYIYLSFSSQKSSRDIVSVFAVINRYNYCGGVGTGFEGYDEIPLSGFEKFSIEQKKARIKGGFFIEGNFVEVDLAWSPSYGGTQCVTHDRSVSPWGTYRYVYHYTVVNTNVDGEIQFGFNQFQVGEEGSGGVISHDRGKSSFITKTR